MSPGRRRRHSPLVLAGALAEASAKAVLGASTRLAGEAVDALGRAAGAPAPERALEHVGRAVAQGRVAVGPLRLEEHHVDALRRQLAGALRGLLLDDRGRPAGDPAVAARAVLATLAGDDGSARPVDPRDELRRRFADLLDGEEPGEQATVVALLDVVRQLTPDQARLLRSLAEDGPGVAVVVESTTLLGRVSAVRPEVLTTLGERAGCDEPDRAPAMLRRLEGLGLVATMVDEGLADGPQVARIEETEAHREVAAAVRDAGGRPRSRPSRVHLTAAGRQLLEVAHAPRRDDRVASPGPVRSGPRPGPGTAPAPVEPPAAPRPDGTRVSRPDRRP